MNFDVIVIGSGQAGVPLATRLAAAGQTVMIAERGNLGGTCVNTGCTPTKTMIASARAAHVARTASRLGIRVPQVEVDLAAIVDRKDAIVERWRAGTAKRLNAERLTLIRGHARFAGERQIVIGGQTHTAPEVIINTGARPLLPPIDGLGQVPWLDNHGAMNVRELPGHLIVIGGGYIGCELGQMFRRFGSRVTIVDHSRHLLGRAEPEVSTALEEVFRAEGLELRLGAGVARVSGGPGVISVQLANGDDLRGTHLLIAGGRRPNTDDLDCEKGNVALDAHGYVVADDHYLTSCPGVHAVGDVIGGPQFTHTSWDDHRLLYEILRNGSRRGRNGRFIPSTAFTDPQVASVGMTEQEARDKGLAVEIATMPFGSTARAVEVDETAGVMKIILDAKTERVLGASIAGAEAGELIHIFVTLMQAGASARAIVDAQFVHPTFAEGVQSAVMKLERYKLQ
jgi:pyruvate/2-oxoglutarate dehydrogenase complex dihydrolipoamide dehydrogenase (E3) component